MAPTFGWPTGAHSRRARLGCNGPLYGARYHRYRFRARKSLDKYPFRDARATGVSRSFALMIPLSGSGQT